MPPDGRRANRLPPPGAGTVCRRTVISNATEPLNPQTRAKIYRNFRFSC